MTEPTISQQDADLIAKWTGDLQVMMGSLHKIRTFGKRNWKRKYEETWLILADIGATGRQLGNLLVRNGYERTETEMKPFTERAPWGGEVFTNVEFCRPDHPCYRGTGA